MEQRAAASREADQPLTPRPTRGSGDLLPGVQEPLWIEITLDLAVERDRPLAPLPGEPAAADEPQPVLTRDSAAQLERHRQQVVRRAGGTSELVRIVGREQEGGVD